MRSKLLLILVGVCLGSVLTVLTTSNVPVSKADCPNCFGEPWVPWTTRPCGNGDVNGDGQLNVSDVSTLVRYLFTSGPTPASLPNCLPATGQTKCYDAAGTPTSCNSSVFPGQDGFYPVGCPMEERFVDNKDGTVTDKCTGLMWQDRTANPTANYCADPGVPYVSWQETLIYCKDLGDPGKQVDQFFDGAGYDDWRTPDVRELQSIVDYSRGNFAVPPEIKLKPIPPQVTWRPAYWSSTTVEDSIPSDAWVVRMDWGDVSWLEKGDRFYCLACRTIQPGETP